jgi:COP9 signalosome complex subunit 5
MASEGGNKQAQKRWELENDVTMSVDDETDLAQNHLGGGQQRRSKKGESSSGSGGSKQAKFQNQTANEQKQQQQQQSSDHFWKYESEVQAGVAQQAPWAKDPHYFKHAYISALALLKMTIHTKQGGNIEVMGMLQGKPVGDSIVVVDVFVLPVEGTETRVNAQAEAYEYMVEYNQRSKESGRQENVVGWYHSHPGYGCWLSGIDVNTQLLNQEYTEPFLAIVIDPIRTQAAGKVEIGAFRTYPKDYKAPDDGPSEYQTIPLNKIEDFGVHCKQYYSLEITYFKSSLDSHLFDLLWNKYWVSTLSSSKIVASAEYIAGQVKDLVEKLEQVEGSISHAGRLGGLFVMSERKKQNLSQLSKISQDGCKIATEQIQSMLSQTLKETLFNSVAQNQNERKASSQSQSLPVAMHD